MLPSAIDLHYFYSVAAELHFSHAAKKLNVSQPSLSIAIKRLEKLLETPLFIRHKQGVTLTRAGNQLLNDVKKLLMQWEKTVSDIKEVNQSIKGEVRIGCHSTLTPFMSNMVSELLEQNLGLAIHFQHDSTPKVMQNLVKGELDIGLVTDPYLHPEVIIQQIALTDFTYWVSIKHQAKINLYAKDTIIICDPQLPQTQYLMKQLLKKTKHQQLKLNAMNHIEAIAAMTVEGYGVGILPSSFTGQYFGDKLQKIPDAPVYEKPLCIAYRPENKSVAAIQLVIHGIRNLAKIPASKAGINRITK